MSTEETLVISEIPVAVTRKQIKNLHLAVYPPTGRVTVSAPEQMPISAVRIAVVTRLAWVKRQRREISLAPRQSIRDMTDGESHYFLGRRYRMRVVERSGPTRISTRGKATLVLEAREDASISAKLNALDRWYRERLGEVVPPLLEEWSQRLELDGITWRMRRMRTRWATINVKNGIVSVNPEIAKQSLESIESVVVHELMHIFEPNHGEGFIRLLDMHLPDWRARKSRLDTAMLSCEDWKV